MTAPLGLSAKPRVEVPRRCPACDSTIGVVDGVINQHGHLAVGRCEGSGERWHHLFARVERRKAGRDVNCFVAEAAYRVRYGGQSEAGAIQWLRDRLDHVVPCSCEGDASGENGEMELCECWHHAHLDEISTRLLERRLAGY